MKDTVTISIERFKELELKEQELTKSTKWVELSLGIYERCGLYTNRGTYFKLSANTSSGIVDIVRAVKESKVEITKHLEYLKESKDSELSEVNRQLNEAVLIEREIKNDLLNKLNKIPNWIKKIFV